MAQGGREMIRRLKAKETAQALCVDEHVLKPLREYGFVIGTKAGKGYVYDTEEIEMFIRLTRGFDISNTRMIAEAAAILKPQNKMPHPRI